MGCKAGDRFAQFGAGDRREFLHADDPCFPVERDRRGQAGKRLARHIYPVRQQNNRALYRNQWWLFGEPRPGLRRALATAPRYIATSRTAKHRIFSFLPAGTLPDTKIVAIALDDGSALATLSSLIHIVWAARAGGWLGVGNEAP